MKCSVLELIDLTSLQSSESKDNFFFLLSTSCCKTTHRLSTFGLLSVRLSSHSSVFQGAGRAAAESGVMFG